MRLKWRAYILSHIGPRKPDPSDFGDEILPLLESVPVPGDGSCHRPLNCYCSLVRRGDKIPHPMHRKVLLAVANGSQ